VVRTKQKRRLTTKAENTFYQCQWCKMGHQL
jgi:hypothetical protein